MVFIFLGAVKAAKVAKIEMQKNKQRNEMIQPVEGSSDMMADRNNGTTSSGADTWWGTARTSNAPAEPQSDAPTPAEQNGCVGAWSRTQNVPSGDPDHSSASSASTDARGRPVSQSSSSGHGSQVLPSVAAPPLALEPPPPAVVEPAPARASDPVRERREPRARPPRKPRAAEGSFEAVMRGERPGASQEGPVMREERTREEGSAAEDRSLAAVMRGEAAAAARPAKTRSTVADDGSFSVAIRLGAGAEPAPARGAGSLAKPQVAKRRSKAVEGSFEAAMHSPRGGEAKAADNGSAGSKGTAGSLFATEKPAAGTGRAKGKAGAAAEGSFEAVMRADGARARAQPSLRHATTAPTPDATPVSAMSYPAGSKVRRGPRGGDSGTGGAKPSAARDAVPKQPQAAVVSSMSAQGTMKRRVTRR